ncbi:MAG: DUF2330 domain-containing protein [Phycisphaerales bacterium]|nr:MAG: DUF2330 domain-containing protein [Phycisphaerales bacterium]
MNSARSLLSRVLVLVLIICSVDSVFADGKFFRRLEVADEPGIRAQRAVIAFKDGIETLIVQSDVEGEDTSYGWLLPLPAKPTSIEPCQANSLNALGGVVQPEIADTPRSFLAFSIVFMLILVAACIDHVRLKARGTVRTSPARVLLGVVVVLLLAMLLLPSLIITRGGLSGGVDVLQTVKAGVYDVTIIKGQTGEAVRDWLASNGFASPPSASAIIQDYVSSGWCFLAAKVSPEASGTSTHHPLKVAFPTSQAVYPLQLTGSDGDPVRLDLFVIADRRASAAAMRTWVCDSYGRGEHYHRFEEFVCEVPPIYKGRQRPFSRIGIPAVSELMWPGCVVTRLHARLDASDMREDLSLRWLAPKPMRVTLHGLGGAVAWSAAVGAIALGLSFAWFTRTAVKRGWSWQMLIRRRLVFAVLAGLLMGAARYATLETVPMKATGRQELRSMVALSAHRHALQQLAANLPESPFPVAYRDLLMASESSEALQEGTDLDKPGDFKIEATDGGWRLTIIDWPYIPITIPISSDGTPQAAGV